MALSFKSTEKQCTKPGMYGYFSHRDDREDPKVQKTRLTLGFLTINAGYGGELKTRCDDRRGRYRTIDSALWRARSSILGKNQEAETEAGQELSAWEREASEFLGAEEAQEVLTQFDPKSGERLPQSTASRRSVVGMKAVVRRLSSSLTGITKTSGRS